MLSCYHNYIFIITPAMIKGILRDVTMRAVIEWTRKHWCTNRNPEINMFVICDVICENPTHVCRKRWNGKIKEINIIILMVFFIFIAFEHQTVDTSIRGDPSKKCWKENNSNFHMIPSITQKINFVPCDGFSQITWHLFWSIWCMWTTFAVPGLS